MGDLEGQKPWIAWTPYDIDYDDVKFDGSRWRPIVHSVDFVELPTCTRAQIYGTTKENPTRVLTSNVSLFSTTVVLAGAVLEVGDFL